MKVFDRNKLVFGLLLILPLWASATTRTTTGGQWTSTSTWSGGVVPASNGSDNITSSTSNLKLYVNASGLAITGATFSKASTLTLYSNTSLTINGNMSGSSDLTIVVGNGATLIINGSLTSSNGAISITVYSGGTLIITGGVTAKNNVSIIAGGDVDITGNVSSTSGNVTLNTYSTGDMYIDGSVTANNDLDITSDNTTHITGGVSGGNNTSFTVNDELIIDGVISVGNSATFTTNGSATFESGGLTANNNTNITVNGDMYIDGDVNLGQGTSLTVNGSATLTTTGDFTAGGGHTSYVVHGEMIVGGNLSLDNGHDVITGYGTVTTGGSCNYNTSSSTTITQNCDVTKEVALPVTLIDFSADLEDAVVTLSWSTASESDNDFFTILRSYDGVSYDELTTVSGQGNSKSEVSYEWIDDTYAYRQAYYQLWQTDYDGTEEFLKTVVVYPKNTGIADVKIGPNPVASGASLKILNFNVTGATYQLISLSGKVVKRNTIGSSNEISTEGIESGIYILQMDYYGAGYSGKIMIK